LEASQCAKHLRHILNVRADVNDQGGAFPFLSQAMVKGVFLEAIPLRMAFRII